MINLSILAKYYGMELAHPNILPGNAMITADIHQKLESCKHNKLVIVVVPDDSKKEHSEYIHRIFSILFSLRILDIKIDLKCLRRSEKV